MLRGCVTLFGEERGDEIEATIERLTGSPCPCKVGQDCVLLPAPAPVSAEL